MSRFKKNPIIYSLLLISAVLILFLFGNRCSLRAEQTGGGEITFSIERFTIGQGYLIEPVRVRFDEGQTVADVVLDQLKIAGYKPELANENRFYLAGIENADTGHYQVPLIIRSMKDMTNMAGEGLTAPTGSETNIAAPDLCELSYTSCAGWMYSVNGVFPSEALNGKALRDGDVVRIQFSLYAYGGDLGDHYGDNPVADLPDRNPMTDRLAKINQYKDVCLAQDDVRTAYDAAYAAVTDMDVSKETFQSAYEALPSEEEIASWVKKAYTPAKVTLASVKAGKKKAKVTWKKIGTASGYQLEYSARKTSGYKKLATIKKAKTVTYIKTRLKSKKVYYFRVRAYRTVHGITYYGPWSGVKKAKIK